MIMFNCRVNRHLSTVPLLGTAFTPLDLCRVFCPAAVVSGQPTSINRAVAGRCLDTAEPLPIVQPCCNSVGLTDIYQPPQC